MICFLRGSQVFQTQIRFRTKKSSSFIFSGTQKKKKKNDSIRPQILSISFHEITIFIVKKKIYHRMPSFDYERVENYFSKGCLFSCKFTSPREERKH